MGVENLTHGNAKDLAIVRGTIFLRFRLLVFSFFIHLFGLVYLVAKCKMRMTV